MTTLPTPEEAAASFVSEKLRNPAIRKVFLDRPRDGKTSVLLVHLIGAETERYAAEHVYSVTGKGALRSKGVDGLREEKELEAFLRSAEGRPFVDRTLKLVSQEIMSEVDLAKVFEDESKRAETESGGEVRRVAVSNMEKGASSPFA